MPNTLIREGYLDSDRISALSDFDDRVFFRLLLAADDAGRNDGRSDKLRSATFPTREAVRGADVEKAIERLSACALVSRWEWDGKPVIQIMRWQRRSGAKYSRFPDRSGKFEISWMKIQTRDGQQAFSSTSLPEGWERVAQPIDNPFDGVSEISTDTETETETKSETNTKKSSSPDPPGFVRFWNAYPEPGKESKKQARQVWTASKLEDQTETVLAGVERWKLSRRWRDGFIKAAHRFLRDEMFEANPEVAASKEFSNANGNQRKVQPFRGTTARPSPEL